MRRNQKRETVYIYQFPRPSFVPNISPFCLKVESFCRLYKIPFEIEYVSTKRSKNGLLPFIELNGEQIADSQLIVLHLQKHFNIPELPEQDEAIARAVDRMVDIHTGLVMGKNKILDHPENIDIVLNTIGMPWMARQCMCIVRKVVKKKVTERVSTVLGGQFSDADMRMILMKDFTSLKTILGSKPFLMGEAPTWVDCTVFGHLATMYYLPTSNIVKDLLASDYPTLAAYLERAKEAFFGEEFVKD